MSTRAYVVQQGDYFTQLALRFGFDADTVWNLPENRALRELRTHRDVLHPGDIVHVPATRASRGVELTTHSANRFKARVPTVPVRIKLRDASNAPLADKSFRVMGVRPPHNGTTDGEGVASFAVPVHVREVRLVLEDAGQEFRVLIGDMDPIEERSGLRKRLEHLGFAPRGAPSSGDADEPLRAAIKAFQTANELEPTGEADQGTRDALARVHGS